MTKKVLLGINFVSLILASATCLMPAFGQSSADQASLSVSRPIQPGDSVAIRVPLSRMRSYPDSSSSIAAFALKNNHYKVNETRSGYLHIQGTAGKGWIRESNCELIQNTPEKTVSSQSERRTRLPHRVKTPTKSSESNDGHSPAAETRDATARTTLKVGTVDSAGPAPSQRSADSPDAQPKPVAKNQEKTAAQVEKEPKRRTLKSEQSDHPTGIAGIIAVGSAIIGIVALVLLAYRFFRRPLERGITTGWASEIPPDPATAVIQKQALLVTSNPRLRDSHPGAAPDDLVSFLHDLGLRVVHFGTVDDALWQGFTSPFDLVLLDWSSLKGNYRTLPCLLIRMFSVPVGRVVVFNLPPDILETAKKQVPSTLWTTGIPLRRDVRDIVAPMQPLQTLR